MTKQSFGTIAALKFTAKPKQGFEDIVEELDITFRPFGLNRRSLTWDNDDIAIIERDSLRVLLGWLPSEKADGSSFMVFAVGHATNGGNLLVNRETCEFVKEVLLTHLDSYLDFEAVFHSDATQPVGIELVDTATEILHRDFAETVVKSSPRVTTKGIPQVRVYTRDLNIDKPAPRIHTPSMDDVDSQIEALSGEVLPVSANVPAKPEPMSLPKHLTIYALGATMLIYTPPVGASLLAYSALRDLTPEPVAA